MRSWGVGIGVLVMLGCGAKSPQHSSPTKADVDADRSEPKLICPDPEASHTRSPESSLPLTEGGYSRLQDIAALQTFRDAIEDHLPTPQEIESMDSKRMSRAFMAAFSDLTPEIRECIRKAETIVPNLQYTLRLRMFGRPGVGSFVESTQFLRIDGVKGTDPVEVKSDAGLCVETLIGRLALPPSQGLSELLTIVRYDGCSAVPRR